MRDEVAKNISNPEYLLELCDLLDDPCKYSEGDVEDAADIIRHQMARIAELEAALKFYADEDNWRRNGPLDPNSANFTGGPATAALKEKGK
jgi:hypothetical protein